MKSADQFIKSGILEIYVLGVATDAEIKAVEQMAALHKEVRDEIDEIGSTLKGYAEWGVPAPNKTIKPMILASIDYYERIKKGEEPTFPKVLNEKSAAQDYSQWLSRPDMVLPKNAEDIFVKLIGYTSQVTTGIVWIKTETPYEVHDDEHEKFLILEGTCDITINGIVHKMVPGDYMSIPLHAGHTVKVTSNTPCKVILQRVAA